MYQDVKLAIVDEAMRLLRLDGWCQHRFRIGSRRCVMAALSDAILVIQPKAHLPRQWIYNEIRECLRQAANTMNPPGWNDQYGRTVQQVIKALADTRQLIEQETC